jgi:hypothetical protein
MNSAAGLILATGAITLANEALDAPYSKGVTPVATYINWRIIPATGVAALIFTGLNDINPKLAKMLAGLSLFTVLFVQFGNSVPPVEHLAELMGYLPTPKGATPAPVTPPNLSRVIPN